MVLMPTAKQRQGKGVLATAGQMGQVLFQQRSQRCLQEKILWQLALCMVQQTPQCAVAIVAAAIKVEQTNASW